MLGNGRANRPEAVLSSRHGVTRRTSAEADETEVGERRDEKRKIEGTRLVLLHRGIPAPVFTGDGFLARSLFNRMIRKSSYRVYHISGAIILIW